MIQEEYSNDALRGRIVEHGLRAYYHSDPQVENANPIRESLPVVGWYSITNIDGQIEFYAMVVGKLPLTVARDRSLGACVPDARLAARCRSNYVGVFENSHDALVACADAIRWIREGLK